MDRSDQALSKVRDFIERQNVAVDGRIPPERTLASELRRGSPLGAPGTRCARTGGPDPPPSGTRNLHRHSPRQPAAPMPAGGCAAARRCPPSLSAALENVLDYTNPARGHRGEARDRAGRWRAWRHCGRRNPRSSGCRRSRPRPARRATPKRTSAPIRCSTGPSPKRPATRCFSRSSTPCALSQRDVGWRRLGENAHCYKRQSVYANFHESIAAAIAARNGQEAYAADAAPSRRRAAVHPRAGLPRRSC